MHNDTEVHTTPAPPIKRRIARRLVFCLVTVSAVITLFITAYQLYREYHRDIAMIDSRLTEIERVHLGALAHAVWTTSRTEVEYQLTGILRNPDMQYARVYENGKLWVSLGSPGGSDLVVRTFPLTYQHRGKAIELGHLEIAATLREIYDRLLDRTWLILISNAVKTFFISGFMLFLFQLLVTRHINALAATLQHTDVADLKHPFAFPRMRGRSSEEDEFDVLERAFENMRHRIASAMQDLHQHKQALLRAQRIARLGNLEWHAEQDHISLSETAREILGLENNPSMAEWRDFLRQRIHQDDRGRLQDMLAALAKGKTPPAITARLLNNHGEYRYIRCEVENITTEQQRLASLFAIIQDVTEQTRAQEQYALTARIVSTSNDLMAYVDRDFTYRFVNDAYCEIFGLSPTTMIGARIGDFMDSEAFKRDIRPKINIAFRGRHVCYTTQMADQHQHVHEIEVNYYPYYGGFDRVQGVVVNIRDISERRAAERAQSNFIGIINNSSDLMGICRLDGRWTYLNAAGQKLIGLPPPESVTTYYLWDCVAESDRDFFRTVVLPQVLTSGRWTGEHTLITRNSAEAIAVQSEIIRVDEPGADEPMSIGVVMRDIRQIKQMMNQLQRHRQHLEETVARRTSELRQMVENLEAFSYSVSHDLRAPLRSINGFAQILKEDLGNSDRLDTPTRTHLERILSATTYMGNLIDSLLVLSRIGRQDLVKKQINVSKLCQTVLTRIQDRGTYPPVTVSIQPGMVCLGDPKMIEIVFENLLDNALKYSARTSRPEIAVSSVDVNANRVFCVADNGVGFDMRHCQQLFKPFERLHTGEEFTGIGVGLATVNRIITRHGGCIWAQARPGEGARFFFTLDSSEPVSLPTPARQAVAADRIA